VYLSSERAPRALDERQSTVRAVLTVARSRGEAEVLRVAGTDSGRRSRSKMERPIGFGSTQSLKVSIDVSPDLIETLRDFDAPDEGLHVTE
jgi:hypothetical protein